LTLHSALGRYHSEATAEIFDKRGNKTMQLHVSSRWHRGTLRQQAVAKLKGR